MNIGLRLIEIGFQVFQVGSDYRILKYTRSDGELFFARIQEEFPGLSIYWASDDMAKPNQKLDLYASHRILDRQLAGHIKALVENIPARDIAQMINK